MEGGGVQHRLKNSYVINERSLIIGIMFVDNNKWITTRHYHVPYSKVSQSGQFNFIVLALAMLELIGNTIPTLIKTLF